MSGTYKQGEHKVLSGVYTRIVAALEEVSNGTRGIVTYPFTSDWGPVNVLQECYSDKDFNELYNAENTALTANTVYNHAFKGKPSMVLGYRMATAAAAKGIALLNDDTSAKALELETLYPSKRSFAARVTESLSGGKSIEILEKEKVLMKVEGATVAEIVAALNSSEYVRVKSAGEKLPADNAGVTFSGGNNGEVVTGTEYAGYRAEVEADMRAKAIALDDYTDPAEVVATEGWLRRVRNDGLYITFVNGGPLSWDTNLSAAHQKSKAFNHRAIVNVGNGADGFTAGEVAIYIAARVASVALNRTLTDEDTPYKLVNKKLTRAERIEAKKVGTLILVQQGDKVIIDEAINTLTVPGEDERIEMSKIRVSNALDQMAYDLELFGDEYKKTRSNTPEARETYAATVEKEYFEPLVLQEVFKPGATYRPDPDYHGTNPIYTAKLDEAYFVSGVTPVDSMEKIYQKANVSFN
ncbi:phage tail protein [Lysinibacillus sp. 54212]|uniref:phage tail protein n=1 Tax=Lysinibacillus sp. 54212 TaxID=3119829 RepID=UPI002FCBE378